MTVITQKRTGLRVLARIAIWIVLIAAAVYTAFLAVMLAGTLIDIAQNKAIALLLPLHATLPASASSGRADVLMMSASQASVTAGGFTAPTLGMLGAGATISGLASIALGVVTVVLLLALLRRTLFSRAHTWLLAGATVLYLVAETVGVIVSSLGNWSAASELTDSPELQPYTLGLSGYSGADFSLILIALVCAFAVGSRLRRDVDGLV